VFDEAASWTSEEDGVATLRGDFEIEYTPPVHCHVGGDHSRDATLVTPERAEGAHATSPTLPEHAQDAHGTDGSRMPSPQHRTEVEFVTPASSSMPTAEERDPAERRYRTVQNIDEVLEQELHLTKGEEPTTLSEA
jgi:hypothetical protein